MGSRRGGSSGLWYTFEVPKPCSEGTDRRCRVIRLSSSPVSSYPGVGPGGGVGVGNRGLGNRTGGGGRVPGSETLTPWRGREDGERTG